MVTVTVCPLKGKSSALPWLAVLLESVPVLSPTLFLPGVLAIIEDGDAAPGSFESYHLDLLPNIGPPMDVDEYGIPAVYPPYDLVCTVTEENAVDMSWTNAEEYDAINIYKDYYFIAVLPGYSTNYTVEVPGPGIHTLWCFWCGWS